MYWTGYINRLTINDNFVNYITEPKYDEYGIGYDVKRPKFIKQNLSNFLNHITTVCEENGMKCYIEYDQMNITVQITTKKSQYTYSFDLETRVESNVGIEMFDKGIRILKKNYEHK